MERMNPRSRSDDYGSRINRDHSKILATAVPWASVMLGSLLAFFPIATAMPLLPPLGFLLLVAWRLQRPGLLPVWAGFPLGMWDDLFSGQPFGSGILLWSLAMIAIEMIETQFPWRNFMLDWATASGIVAAYLLVAALFSGASATDQMIAVLLPQFLVSVMVYPAVSGVVSRLDRLRLMRIKVIG